MHLLFALPGLHRVQRGAEVVFESVAQEIARQGRHQVTMLGMGEPLPERAYDFHRVPAVSRSRFEHWPKLPFLRHEFMYEELTFAAALLGNPVLGKADITMTCSYPYTSWALRRARKGGRRTPHVFVTQNGDWPAQRSGPEPRFFSCDGLICTNPVYFQRNRKRWRAALIPNGMNPERFHPGPGDRSSFDLPAGHKVVLMVSALDPGKRVLEAMRAVALVKDAFLMVAGDGPLREQVDALAAELLPGRFHRGTFRYEEMPALYRGADVFLHTKILESFGNVYVEALASGTPIVAHDDEVTRWILGNHATLVDSTSERMLADAIAGALKAGRGNGEAAAAWARTTYAWPAIAGKYLDFFEHVLKSGACADGGPQSDAPA